MRRRLLPLGCGALLLAAFVLLGVLAAAGPIGPDATVADVLRGEWRRPPGTVAAVVSVLLGPATPVAAAVLLLAGVALAYRRADRWLLGVLLRCFVVGVACRLVSVLKLAFDRRRPRLYPDFSYPSGHVVSVATTAFVAILLCLWLAQRLLPLVITLAVFAVLVCAAARLVLGVHWVTDTVGATLGVTGVGLLVADALGLLPVTARQRIEAPKAPDASAVE
ncbi:MAG: phosphatase PAP2 family protein [Sciscionella sp.]